MNETPSHRARIVLIAPPSNDAGALERAIAAALEGGDVASLILPAHGRETAEFQRDAAPLVEIAQARGVAVMIAGDTRVAGRIGADGIHVDRGLAEIADAVEKFQPGLMVGAGGARTRHEALEIGELRPDYLFFGMIGGDTRPEPHRRNLALAEWWSQMVAIPCIVQAGADIESVAEAARTGADFVALGEAVLGTGRDPAAMVTRANALLDEAALAVAE